MISFKPLGKREECGVAGLHLREMLLVAQGLLFSMDRHVTLAVAVAKKTEDGVSQWESCGRVFLPSYEAPP